MRWVTYLSPSGGAERPGVVDDGCVFGYPGHESVPALLAENRDALADAYQRALAAPVEIIVEFETRLCPPVRPSAPVTVVVGAGERREVDPALVRGTDDGVMLPAGMPAVSAAPGVAAVFGGGGRHAGYCLACLWRTPEGADVALTLGPAIVTGDEFDGSDLAVTAAADGTELAAAVLDGKLAWAEGLRGEIVAALPAGTRPLEPGEELFIDGGVLGEYELRVGSGA
ncbi:hypothetical protein [Marinitenerispora sediminis]|uniref:Uncharacterized protein n=1 Tax=Marinitenerispora sediminis TaxID=1931232 RepID=A0A368T6V1_9ACTN|nr:hypothetical protein [Marinitenerispora sediminis]RCV51010.1 hypothetical protein DEF23_21165 [Marinitenerispora sediminis]RCV52615.1 hypothetical protein DEF28_12450 [Marinitenerispora sediminis]RCV59582.1 hypothetical protein DEF24_09375 [Marinitenerispora sediminis]